MKPNKVRLDILDIIMKEGGHPGGCFSCVDIMVYLYDNVLKEEDKFILSKGHAYPTLYCILKEKGLNPALTGHPDIDIENGIECTTGSLGQGLPIAVGLALAKKLKKEEGNIYVLLGDGESQEGTTWESLMVASHHKLDNLTVIIDRNNLQAIGEIDNVLQLDNYPHYSLYDKILAFGCNPISIDGHNEKEIKYAIDYQMPVYNHPDHLSNIPKVIIANTIKGKGVSYMENKLCWHVRKPTQDEYKQAVEELA